MIIPPLPVIIRALLVWLLLAAAESVHGTLRRLLLEPILGDFNARRVAVLTGTALVFLVSVTFVGWIRTQRAAHLLLIGLGWAALTLAFEIGLGRLFGLSWNRIGSDYDILHGGLMPLGLLAMALAPLTSSWLRRGAHPAPPLL